MLIIINNSVDATLDAFEQRVGRYANHSRRNANIITRVTTVNGWPRLYFRAITAISKGDELLYDYGERRADCIKENPWLRH